MSRNPENYIKLLHVLIENVRYVGNLITEIIIFFTTNLGINFRLCRRILFKYFMSCLLRDL